MKVHFPLFHPYLHMLEISPGWAPKLTMAEPPNPYCFSICAPTWPPVLCPYLVPSLCPLLPFLQVIATASLLSIGPFLSPTNLPLKNKSATLSSFASKTKFRPWPLPHKRSWSSFSPPSLLTDAHCFWLAHHLKDASLPRPVISPWCSPHLHTSLCSR